jgi:hypothetical protein
MLQRQEKIVLCIAAIAVFCGMARAQVIPPFYSPLGTPFTPEIGVVNTGILHDAQGIVSADEKYVTITMGSASAGLLALHEFSFQGGANGVPSGGGQAGQPPAPVGATILDRRGITRVD